MSSRSPSPQNPNVVVVGSFWNAPLIASAFQEAGEGAVTCLVLDRPAESAPYPDEIFLSIGNGEYFENACRIFGADIATELWDISRSNYRRAIALFARHGIAYEERGTVWYAREPREKMLLEETGKRLPDADASVEEVRIGTRQFVATLREPGLTFSPREMGEKLGKGCRVRRVRDIDSIERAGTLDVRVKFDGEALTTPVLVIASQVMSPRLLPSFADKWLQVTLGSFSYPCPPGLDFSLAIFNGGADFAVRESQSLRLGSFRNLYMDKAVGVHAGPDPVTLQGISRFFSELGWIKLGDVPRPHVEVQTLSCDGLPLAGTLPDLPGVYLLAGFSGRMQNYLFEIAPALAEGVVREKGFGRLRLFSTKRFV